MFKEKVKLYLQIFISFLKISAFTFGGGYAMIPLLKSEIVEKNKWITSEELTDIYSMVQVIPGVIYVSTSSYIGYKVGGIIGAIISSVAALIPSGASIMILYLLFRNYYEYEIFGKIVTGIISGIIVTTVLAAWEIGKNSVKNIKGVIILIITLILIEIFNVKAIYIICFGILVGVLYTYVSKLTLSPLFLKKRGK